MKESQLENKTSIATNDYVRMVDENGNSVKIKKDSFMAAIRDALPSIISDGETGGGSVLSIINGVLKSRTDANLASVLGGVNPRSIPWNGSFDDYITQGLYDIYTGSDMFYLVVLGSSRYKIQIRVNYNDKKFYFRRKYGDNWSEWVVIG